MERRADQFRRKLPPKILPPAATGAVRVTTQSEGERGRSGEVTLYIRQGEREGGKEGMAEGMWAKGNAR